MLQLNDSGALLWKVLEDGGDKNALVDAMLNEYNVTVEQAEADIDAFLNILIQSGCMEQ